jgi:hypothetical protein
VRFGRAAWFSIPVLLATLSSLPARAYVRYITDEGKPYYWPMSCAPVTVYLNHFQQMTPDEVAKSITAAAHAWSPSAVTCTDGNGGTSSPYFEVVPSISENGTPPPVGWDGHNTVIFRTENWTMSGLPDGRPYQFNALALTSVVARPDGRIVDADMEINAVDITNWADLDPGSGNTHGTDAYDLQNAITHEFGHFIGLDHTCRLEPPDPTVVDNQGNPVPQCGPALPPLITDAVMYPTIEVNGELKKRTLSSDDVQAVCDIYPARLDPQNCPLDTPYEGCTGSCRTVGSRRMGAPADGLGAASALLVAVLLTSLRRRRGGARPSAR